MITEEMKALIDRELAIVATVDQAGDPNIGPKRSMRYYDAKTLMFNENTGGQTMANIEQNGKIEVAFIDRQALKGYRFMGKAEMQTSGPLYEEAKLWAQGKMKEPKAVGIIHIERVFNLQSGPNAGKEIL
ncbi:pyridoxamine 5'-phosphate oxidase family protein [Streptococcus halichoeri]|uniref:pyridoxamine 5'-phosphate oxidase family protein n=1 Tax=Streptococcus halichoeri TaxID=254785 RepID=UPI00135AD6E1|nr:pyridoxamine 5'-phosphate oxidase family protein [Streptococcus halichoeri]